MALSGFKLFLARVVESSDEPREELVQIGGIFPDWHSVSGALQDYYAHHGGADLVRREFKGGIRVEWVKGDEADAPTH
jgi:hypothetical protein